MEGEGIEPPMFTRWDLIYSQVQHNQQLPPLHWQARRDSNPD